MVNTLDSTRTDRLQIVSRLVALYVAVVVATVLALAVLAQTHPHQATTDAWVHAAIVAVFAVILPLRLRAARHGSRSAVDAVAVVATVVTVVNVVEACIPGLFPTWMRVEMVAIAVLTASVAVTARRARR